MKLINIIKRIFFIIKYWLVSKEVPKILRTLENALMVDSSRPTNSTSDLGLAPTTTYTINFISIFMNHIATKNDWVHSADDNYLEIEERVVKNFIVAFQKGKCRNLDDYIAWYMPKIMDKPPKLTNENIKHKNALTRNYGQLSKIAELLQYAFSREGMDINSIFEEKYPYHNIIYTPNLNDFMSTLLEAYAQVINDINSFSEKYSIPLDEGQKLLCFYNIANFYIHNLAMKGKAVPMKKRRELFWAVSALHPVQDRLIDEFELTKQELNSITDALNSNIDYSLVSERIKPLIHLINIVYSHLPASKHKRLQNILNNLQRIQIDSMLQKKKNANSLSENDLLSISFTKGGYAFALFAYVINGELDSYEFEHFFSMGAIFQLMDDLHDLEDDLLQGSDTIFTRDVRNNKKIDATLYGLMEMQRTFETRCGLPEKLEFPLIVKMLANLGFRYDTFRFSSMQSDYLSDNFFLRLKETLPFDTVSTVEFYKNSVKDENLDNFGFIIEDLQKLIQSLSTQ